MSLAMMEAIRRIEKDKLPELERIIEELAQRIKALEDNKPKPGRPKKCQN